MNDITMAIQIALIAHDGQLDKAGYPYILHPIRVMSNFTQEKYQIVAVLHDVYEDSDRNILEVKDLFGEEIYDALNLLTHEKRIPYSTYIKALKNNDIARAVKLQDLKDNTNKDRFYKALEKLDDNGKDRLIRKSNVYDKAIKYLKDKITDY